jgi:glutathione peroxidase
MKDTQNSSGKKETFKQKILRKLYPLFRKLSKKGKNGTKRVNTQNRQPVHSVYDYTVHLNNGQKIDLKECQNRKIIFVNTASDCGYTGQYAELQSLYANNAGKLMIIAFPSNDFAGQEKASDSDIASFCQINYGVTFPVAVKGSVLKKENQQPVFTWLTNAALNGWNDHQPDWNFGKYIVNESGILTHYFGPSVSPDDPEFLNCI